MKKFVFGGLLVFSRLLRADDSPLSATLAALRQRLDEISEVRKRENLPRERGLSADSRRSYRTRAVSDFYAVTYGIDDYLLRHPQDPLTLLPTKAALLLQRFASPQGDDRAFLSAEEAHLLLPLERRPPDETDSQFYLESPGEKFALGHFDATKRRRFRSSVRAWIESRGYQISKNKITSPQQAPATPLFARNEIPWGIWIDVDSVERFLLLKTFLARRAPNQESADWNWYHVLNEAASSPERGRLAAAMLVSRQWSLREVVKAIRRVPDPTVKEPRLPDFDLSIVVKDLRAERPILDLGLEHFLALHYPKLFPETLSCLSFFKRPAGTVEAAP